MSILKYAQYNLSFETADKTTMTQNINFWSGFRVREAVIKCFENAEQFNCCQQQFLQFLMNLHHSVMSDSLQPRVLYSPRNSLGQNTAVGNLSLLQGIFPAQELNPGLPHCRQILYQLSHKGSPLRSYRTDCFIKFRVNSCCSSRV